MKLTVWNKVIQGLITSNNHSSCLLGIILLDDYDTLLQWWQYDKGMKERDIKRDINRIGLPPLKRTSHHTGGPFVTAWDRAFPYRVGKSYAKETVTSEGYYNKDVIEEKYRQYADKYL